MPPWGRLHFTVPSKPGMVSVSSPLRPTRVKLSSLTALHVSNCTSSSSRSLMSASFGFTCLVSRLVGILPSLALGGNVSRPSTMLFKSR